MLVLGVARGDLLDVVEQSDHHLLVRLLGLSTLQVTIVLYIEVELRPSRSKPGMCAQNRIYPRVELKTNAQNEGGRDERSGHERCRAQVLGDRQGERKVHSMTWQSSVLVRGIDFSCSS